MKAIKKPTHISTCHNTITLHTQPLELKSLNPEIMLLKIRLLSIIAFVSIAVLSSCRAGFPLSQKGWTANGDKNTCSTHTALSAFKENK